MDTDFNKVKYNKHLLGKHDRSLWEEFGNRPFLDDGTLSTQAFRFGNKVQEMGTVVGLIQNRRTRQAAAAFKQATGHLSGKERRHEGLRSFGMSHDAILLHAHIAIVKEKQNNGKQEANGSAYGKDVGRRRLVFLFVRTGGINCDFVFAEHGHPRASRHESIRAQGTLDGQFIIIGGVQVSFTYIDRHGWGIDRVSKLHTTGFQHDKNLALFRRERL